MGSPDAWLTVYVTLGVMCMYIQIRMCISAASNPVVMRYRRTQRALWNVELILLALFFWPAWLLLWRNAVRNAPP